MKTLLSPRSGLLLVLLFAVFVSCKKERIERKYTGDFLFTVDAHTWDLSDGTYDTTYTHAGRILITEPPTGVSGVDPKDVYIQIDFSYNGLYRRTAVSKKGVFTSPGCEGSFVNENELNCVFTHSALSSSSRYTIHGVRR